MTVSSTTRITTPFTGTGVSVPTFAFGFKVFVNTDILAVITYLGVQTTLTLTSDYSVALNADQDAAPGGSISLNAASATAGIAGGILAVGATMVLSSQVPQLQNTTLTNFGGFFPSVINAMVDRLTILVQQLALTIGRGITFPITDSSSLTTQLPAAGTRANQTLVFDSVGNVSVGSVSTAPVSTAMQPVVAAASLSAARTALGLATGATTTVGTMATQNANAVAVTGGAVSGVTIDNAPLGATTPSTAAVTQMNGGALAGFRNALHNGTMQIAQFGTSIAASTNLITWTLDRWAFLQAAGTVAATIAQQSSPAVGVFKSLRIQRNAANTNTSAIILGQAVESRDAIQYQNQQVTLSFYGKCGANYSAASSLLSVQVDTGTGTDEGTALLLAGTWTSFAATISSNVTLTTTRQKFSITGTLPSGMTEAGVRFQYTPVGTAGANDWFEIDSAQLESGSVATPIEPRPYQVELALCQRHLFVTFPDGTVPAQNAGQSGQSVSIQGYGANSANQGSSVVPYPVPMRASPTVTTYSPNSASAQPYCLSRAAQCSALSPNGASNKGFAYTYTTAASSTSGDANTLHILADARL